MVDNQDKRDISKGYLKVPISLISVFMFMVAQTLGAVWWASGQNANLGFIREQQKEMKLIIESSTKDRYTAAEANKDHSIIIEDIAELKEHSKYINNRVNTFQSKYEGTLQSLQKSQRN